MSVKKIAVLSGDGIGPEVMTETLRVLLAIEKIGQHHFEFIHAKIGGEAYDTYQEHCPETTLRVCREADAILFGSVGGAVAEQHQDKWKNCESNSILTLRDYFNLSINIRPIRIYPEFPQFCPLKKEKVVSGLDCVIFRELTGGLYFGRHAQSLVEGKRHALDECVYHEKQIETIAHAAFQSAATRTKKLCSVDKANVLATSKLWRAIMIETAQHYPDVELTHMLVDNCAMQLVLNPQQFDVIVTENMFGDIISDLAAALTGSLGMVPSASINASGFGLYEPSGGSAPDIAGKGIANPTAQILSAAMMLRHAFNLQKEASAIEQAVKISIVKGILTRDLAGPQGTAVTTTQFVDAVLDNLKGLAVASF